MPGSDLILVAVKFVMEEAGQEEAWEPIANQGQNPR
eukprot:g59054.t1